MALPPRTTPSAPGEAPSPPGAPASSEEEASSNPFASLASPEGAGGETKLYEVPRELIELARARSKSSAREDTLTPIAPRPNPELEATLLAYTAGLANASGRTAPVSEPVGSEPQALRAEPEAVPRTVERALPEREPVLRSPVAPVHQRPSTRASTPWHPWLLYVGLCLVLACCAHLLLSS